MKHRSRKRARVVALDLTILEPRLARASAVGQAAFEMGMRLVSAQAYPCADGSYTIRTVWRQRQGGLQSSMAETIRGVRLGS